jgi:phospholipid transport system transporter-binding protein
MNEIKADPRDADLLTVSGELSFATVPALLEQGSVLLAGCGERIRLDLGGVTRADSAGLALLIEWLRIARRRRAVIEFRNIPPQMLAIARVSGLDSVLPLAQ